MALGCVFLATAAHGQIELRFDPADTTLAVGETCRMSIVIDDPLPAIRTIDVTVTYDAAVVRPLGGGAGTLYTASGVTTFQGFEQPEPGRWHGYAVLMGAGLSIHGPGELYYWNLEALLDGRSPVTAVQVYASTTDGSWFSTVLLPDAAVKVGSGAAAVDGEKPSGGGSLVLAPNPFNPRTGVTFELPEAGWTTITVHDLRGARIATLFEGTAAAGPLAVAWDGRDDDGRLLPGGIYLFTVSAPRWRAEAKGVLLR